MALPSFATYNHASTGNNQYRTWRVEGAGSRIDLSGLTTVTGGTHYNSRIIVEALAGGTIDMSNVSRIEDPNSGDTRQRAIQIKADGQGAVKITPGQTNTVTLDFVRSPAK